MNPCPKFEEDVGPAHKCPDCKLNIHPFCGTPIGEEGYGQAIRCDLCSKKGESVVKSLQVKRRKKTTNYDEISAEEKSFTEKKNFLASNRILIKRFLSQSSGN